MDKLLALHSLIFRKCEEAHSDTQFGFRNEHCSAFMCGSGDAELYMLMRFNLSPLLFNMRKK